MKKVTINIHEDKFSAFMEFLKTLDYVSISKESNFKLSAAHKKILDERLEDYKNNPGKGRDFDEAIKDIEKNS